MQPAQNQGAGGAQKKTVFDSLFGGIKNIQRPLSSVFTRKVEDARVQDLRTEPSYVPPVPYADDFEFARDYMGMNVVITGATGTIGSRLVDQFVENFLPGQVKLALFCKEDDTLPTAVQSQCAVPIHDPNKWIYSYEVDFTNPVRTTTRIQQMMKEMNGVVDCIFFCHGTLNFLGGLSSSVVEYDTVNKVNVRATMHFMSVVMPFLRMKKYDRDDRKGLPYDSPVTSLKSITVLSSSAGEKPWPGHMVYNSAMASLNMLVRCAALENAQHGIRINAVAPGCVRSKRIRTNKAETGFKQQLTPSQNSEYLMEQAKCTPLLQFAAPRNKPTGHYIYQINEPHEVATQIMWLGSNRASFMNGEVMVLDGGVLLTTSSYPKYLETEELNDQQRAQEDLGQANQN